MLAGMEADAICAVGLGKSYGNNRVLDEVRLTVPAGTVFGLLGPNGSGSYMSTTSAPIAWGHVSHRSPPTASPGGISVDRMPTVVVTPVDPATATLIHAHTLNASPAWRALERLLTSRATDQ